MADFIEYKSVRIAYPMPIGEGGITMNQNFKALADRTETFTHSQAVPASTWTINYNLGRPVNVTIMDDDGNVCIADLKIKDMNTVLVVASKPFSATAYLV